MKVDPGLLRLHQDSAPAAGRDIVGEDFEMLPVAGEPLNEQATVWMPVDASDVPFLDAQVHEGRRAVRDNHHAKLYPRIGGARERVTMLFDLQLSLPLMHDRKDGDVGFVELLKGDEVAFW